MCTKSIKQRQQTLQQRLVIEPLKYNEGQWQCATNICMASLHESNFWLCMRCIKFTQFGSCLDGSNTRFGKCSLNHCMAIMRAWHIHRPSRYVSLVMKFFFKWNCVAQRLFSKELQSTCNMHNPRQWRLGLYPSTRRSSWTYTTHLW